MNLIAVHPFLRPTVETLLSAFPWIDATPPELVVSGPGGVSARLEITPDITIKAWIDTDETDIVHLSHDLPGQGWHDRFRAADSPDTVGAVSAFVGEILAYKIPEAWAAPTFSLFRHNPRKPKVGIAGGGTSGHGGFVLLSPYGRTRQGFAAHTDDPKTPEDMAGLTAAHIHYWCPVEKWEPIGGFKDLAKNGHFIPVPPRRGRHPRRRYLRRRPHQGRPPRRRR